MKPRVAFITYNKLHRFVKEVISSLEEWPVKFELHEELLGNAKKKAKEIEKSGNVDVIIASGANAFAIREGFSEDSDIPLVDVKVTGYDIMNALWLAKQKNTNAVIMNYLEHIPQLDWFEDLFQLHVTQVVYKDVQDAEEKLHRVIHKEKQAVIGASLVCEIAERSGGQPIFIYSKDSIKLAIDTAVNLALQRRRELEKRRKLISIMNSVNDGIVFIDNNLNLTEINPAAENILNIKGDEVIRKPIDDILPSLNIKEALYRTNPIMNKIFYFNNNKFIVNKIPVINKGKLIGVLASFQDSANIHSAEIKLRKRSLSKGLVAKYTFDTIIGECELIKKIKDKAKKYASVNTTILMNGETGSGKELFSQSIHNASLRKKNPFVAVNCATLPDHLLESELFGYDEGAFTGAKKGGKEGLFELAHTGTIFLDEIGETPLSLQAQLLRVIQEKEIRRVGGTSNIPVDVRIIVATHRNLKQMIREGKFREDLYYRLNVLSLQLPPLRERVDDLKLLFSFFFQKYGLSEKSIKQLSPYFTPLFKSYHWPGNIRELENICERIAVLVQSDSKLHEITEDIIKDLKLTKMEMIKPLEKGLSDEREETEKLMIIKVLEEVNGNKTFASQKLGISRSTLWRKINDYEIVV